MSDDPNNPTPPEDVSHFPPEMAAERLVALSAAYNKSQPPKGVHELSPEEANQRLAALPNAEREEGLRLLALPTPEFVKGELRQRDGSGLLGLR